MSLTRRRALAALAAAAAATAVGGTASAGPGNTGAADGPELPWPARRGPVAIHAHDDLTARWLLHPSTGRYEPTPFSAIDLSPDGGRLAVVLDDGVNLPVAGVVSRGAWHLRGEAAVEWIDLPNLGSVRFSPCGSALLGYTFARGENGPVWSVHRYDVATGASTSTVLPPHDATLPPQWAADSVRYLVSVVDPEVPDGPGTMRYANPDGALGEVFTVEGGIVRQYSTDRSAVIIEAPLPFGDGEPAAWKTAKVVDVGSGEMIARIPSATVDFGVPTTTPSLGWYDAEHVVRYSPTAVSTTIEVVAAATGEVTRSIPAPGLNPLSYSALRPSWWLTGAARDRSF